MASTQTLHNKNVVKFDNAIDKNGREIGIGDTVNVGEPRCNDLHQYAFTGTVLDVYEDGTICVSDQDSDCFDVDADNVEAG